MLEWFTEDSTVPMVLGTILTIVFLGFWISSREWIMGLIAAIIAFLTIGTVLTETLIETSHEEITERVYSLADHVQANDRGAVIGFVHSDRSDTVKRINQEMPRYNFVACRIIGEKSFELVSDNQANISFVVSARVSVDQHPQSHFVHRQIDLEFEKEDGEWVILGYQHSYPNAGLNP
jgi:hypothetical protein